jgi:hypothetical protein
VSEVERPDKRPAKRTDLDAKQIEAEILREIGKAEEVE